MRIPKYQDKTLSEVFPDVLPPGYGGIFRYIENPPWSEWNIPTNELDFIYILNRSGDKLISPMLHKILGDDEYFTVTQMQFIAALIFDILNPQWSKLFATYDVTYNPIYNFSITKQITETHTDTSSGTKTKGTTEARTLNTSDARTIDRGVVDQSDRSAYNSSTYQPVDKVTSDEDTTDTLLKTGTDTLVYSGSDQDSQSGSGGYTINETRSGFNGNYMYQTAIKLDRELWMDNYFDFVFATVDKLLTIPIYPADNHCIGYAVPRGYPYI